MSTMRVTWGKIRPGKWDQYEALWNAHAAATAATPGLLGRWLLRDGENPDAGYSLSLWESEDAFAAYSARKDQANVGPMTACFVGQYVTNSCAMRGAEIAAMLAEAKT